MKLIIDIPEKTYNEIKDNDMISVADFPMLMYSIKYGEVIDGEQDVFGFREAVI